MAEFCHRSTVFEAVDEVARDVVEGGHRPAALERRRIGDRLRRQRALAEIVGEGRAEPGAIGPLDQAETRPAGRAEPALDADGPCTGEALRRQDEIDERAEARDGSGAEAPGRRHAIGESLLLHGPEDSPRRVAKTIQLRPTIDPSRSLRHKAGHHGRSRKTLRTRAS